jgi:hypothetical protein
MKTTETHSLMLTLLYIDAHQQNMMVMMVSLHRCLKTGSDTDREQQFFKHALRSLVTSSGCQVEMEDWMITSYDVEFSHKIGSGGLYVPTSMRQMRGIISQHIFPVGKYSKGPGTRWM